MKIGTGIAIAGIWIGIGIMFTSPKFNSKAVIPPAVVGTVVIAVMF